MAIEHKYIISQIGFISATHGSGFDAFCELAGSKKLSRVVENSDDNQSYMSGKGVKYLSGSAKMFGNLTYQCLDNDVVKCELDSNPESIGIYNSSEFTNSEQLFEGESVINNLGPRFLSPLSVPFYFENMSASVMSIKTGIRGCNYSLCASDCSSLQAIDLATLHISEGFINKAIVVSTSILSPFHLNIYKEGIKDFNLLKEVGASLLIQKYYDNNSFDSFGIIHKFYNGFITNNSILDIVHKIISSSDASISDIDSIIINSSFDKFNTELTSKLSDENIPIIDINQEIGCCLHAGGIIGVLYSIYHHKNILSSQAINNKNFTIVISVDESEYCVAVLLSF